MLRNFNNLKNIKKDIYKRLYHQNIIDHFENPRNIGSFENDKDVGTGLVGAPACGDVMKLSIKIKNNIIVDSKFKTFGCGSAIASSSFITEYIKNKHIDDAYLITNKEIAKELKLPPVKLHCSMLAQDAVKSAIEDYNNKKYDKI
jgi:Fe-S cluster assembly scaffold IscU